MHFDFIAKIVGAVSVWSIIVYYRIRHPFTWREKFLNKYRKRNPNADTLVALAVNRSEVVYLGKGTHGCMIVGGDCSLKDITNLTATMYSFSFGNSIIPNSKGEYISVNLKKGEVQ